MGNSTVPLTCPTCKKEFQQELTKIKPGTFVKCPFCKASIKLLGDDPQKEIDKKIKNLFSGLRMWFF